MAELGYIGVGTIEFLYEDGEFYFIEMNTRIQVEHPVTEMITGIDLVNEQIKIAAGSPLTITQEDVRIHGAAIECRVNAEHARTFMPSPGRISYFHPPGGLGVRVDSAAYQGYVIPPYYDSLVGKLIVHGRTRTEALMRLRRALDEFIVDGVETTLPLFRTLVRNTDIQNGQYDIHWLEEFLKDEGRSGGRRSLTCLRRARQRASSLVRAASSSSLGDLGPTAPTLLGLASLTPTALPSAKPLPPRPRRSLSTCRWNDPAVRPLARRHAGASSETSTIKQSTTAAIPPGSAQRVRARAAALLRRSRSLRNGLHRRFTCVSGLPAETRPNFGSRAVRDRQHVLSQMPAGSGSRGAPRPSGDEASRARRSAVSATRDLDRQMRKFRRRAIAASR